MATKTAVKGKGPKGLDVSAVLADVAEANEAMAAAAATARTALESRLAEITAERETLVTQLRSLGGKPTSGKRRRSSPRVSNEHPLIVSIATVLSEADEPMGTTDICDAVVKAGYKTNSENYPQMVAQQLSNLVSLRMGSSAVVVRPERGHYKAGPGMTKYLANPSDAVEVTDSE